MFEQFVRFDYLKGRGIVGNRQQLRVMQERSGFPLGIMLGATTRAWKLSEVEAWLASRSTEQSEVIKERAEKAVAGRAASRARKQQALQKGELCSKPPVLKSATPNHRPHKQKPRVGCAGSWVKTSTAHLARI